MGPPHTYTPLAMYPGSQSSAELDAWFVTNGVSVVGPVAFENVQRMLVERRFGKESLVRHSSWSVWRTLAEVDGLAAPHRHEAVRNLGELSAGIEERATGPYSSPPPPPSSAELATPANDSEPPARSSMRPVSVDPVGILAQSSTLEEALMLTLSTMATAGGADIGLLHRYDPEGATVTTTGAHGVGGEALLGERLLEADPTLAAARSGATVVAEPHPGELGRYLKGRLSRCSPGIRGAVMVPALYRGELLAILELGRLLRPFRMKEVARMEEVVEALTERILVMGWRDR